MMLLPGCFASGDRSRHLTPGPAGALAAAPIDGIRVAVLAGDDTQKALYILDTRSDRVERSFGVTKEANAVAGTLDGTLILAVGGSAGPIQVGSLETWTMNGAKESITPLPSPAIAVTRPIDGVVYALIANGNARAAVPVSVPSMSLGAPIPLDANITTLEQCKIGASTYLLYTIGEPGTLMVMDVATRQVNRSVMHVSRPTCLDGGSTIYAISRALTSRSIVQLSVPTLEQVTALDASGDLLALYGSPRSSLDRPQRQRGDEQRRGKLPATCTRGRVYSRRTGRCAHRARIPCGCRR